MDWQQMVSLGIVGATALTFLLARSRRKRRVGLQCSGGCGCSEAGKGSTRPGIIYRGRKGERPEVVLRSS